MEILTVLSYAIVSWIIIIGIAPSTDNLKIFLFRIAVIVIGIVALLCVVYGAYYSGYIEGQVDMIEGRQKVYPVVKELNGIPTDTIYVKIK